LITIGAIVRNVTTTGPPHIVHVNLAGRYLAAVLQPFPKFAVEIKKGSFDLMAEILSWQRVLPTHSNFDRIYSAIIFATFHRRVNAINVHQIVFILPQKLFE
jgi:hypothetical protein